jgi:hypothetical protein
MGANLALGASLLSFSHRHHPPNITMNAVHLASFYRVDEFTFLNRT